MYMKSSFINHDHQIWDLHLKPFSMAWCLSQFGEELFMYTHIYIYTYIYMYVYTLALKLWLKRGLVPVSIILSVRSTVLYTCTPR